MLEIILTCATCNRFGKGYRTLHPRGIDDLLGIYLKQLRAAGWTGGTAEAPLRCPACSPRPRRPA